MEKIGRKKNDREKQRITSREDGRRVDGRQEVRRERKNVGKFHPRGRCQLRNVQRISGQLSHRRGAASLLFARLMGDNKPRNRINEVPCSRTMHGRF